MSLRKRILVNNSNGIIYRVKKVPSNMFEFFIHKRKEYKDGTASYCIGVSPAWDTDKSFVIDTVRGTLNDAKKVLDNFLIEYSKLSFDAKDEE